jgi:hypothetical protein
MKKSNSDKKTIIWDVDDVLQPFSIQSAKKIERKSLKLVEQLKLESQLPYEKYLEMIDTYRVEYQLEANPYPEVLQWFKDHGYDYRHIALTSVPLYLAHLSAHWVILNFGSWIRSFCIVPSERPEHPCPRYDNSKIAFIKNNNLNCDLFIDNNEENIDTANKEGYKTLLFPFNGSKNEIIKALNTIKEII